MKLEEAAKLLNLKTSDLRAFDEIDPFSGVRVKGYISRRQDKRYGAMVIYYADGNTEPQVVYGTPKFHYPFDKNGVFKFPLTEQVWVHEKLDGTNILGYTYWSRRKDNLHVTYKTRLMPFVGDRGAGSFLTMWKRVLDKYPLIGSLVVSEPGAAFGFEMFGTLNQHLIHYEGIPLDARLLFKVDSKGVYPPREFDWMGAVPAAQSVARLGSTHDLYSFYRKHQAELGAELELTEEGYKGSEGYMYYLLRADDREWEVFKCKPEEIQAIHFAAGGLNKAAIMSACYRVLESEDLTVESVSQMLLEDWGQEHIDLALETGRLGKAVQEICQVQAFKEKCLTAYRECGILLVDDKRGLMRHMASLFPASHMRQVYSLLAAEEGIQ